MRKAMAKPAIPSMSASHLLADVARDDLPAARATAATCPCGTGMRCCNHNKGRGRRFGSSPGIGMENVSETIDMSFKRVLGLLCAASVSVVLANAASAQDKTVKIGAIFPLSGGAASAGVHAKAALETAMDIINNAHPELGNFP